MKAYVKRRSFIITVSYLAAAVIVLSFLLVRSASRERELEQLAAANYQHAFTELCTALGEMDSALQKSVYARSPGMVGAVCTEVFGKAMTAQMSLGVLPFSSEALEKTSGFISRVGDYAYFLSRSAASGNGYTQEQLDSLRSLSDTASRLTQSVRSLETDLLDGVLTMDDVYLSETKLGNIEDELAPETLGDGMRLIESEFPETPSLVYDGPFSEHLLRRTAKFIEGKREVTRDEARLSAAAFIGVSPARLTLFGERSGDLPCYYFSADSTGGNVSVAVTKKGGVPVGMLSSRLPGESSISAAEAEKAAIRFLESRGFDGMALTYTVMQDSTAILSFAYKQDGVLCYPDLIKVGVALDTGAVCSFEAKGYIMCHTRRDLPAKSSFSGSVPDGLTLLAEQPAVIPTSGGGEVFCRELKCEDENGRRCLIYVNAATGVQEKILILLEDESGTLAI